MAKLRETMYLGLDVGGTRIKAGLVSDVGQVLTATAVNSHAEGTREQVLADISRALEPFRDKSAICLGAGFPSFGDYDRGVLDSAKSAYPSLHRFPLRHYLEETYGISDQAKLRRQPEHSKRRLQNVITGRQYCILAKTELGDPRRNLEINAYSRT